MLADVLTELQKWLPPNAKARKAARRFDTDFQQRGGHGA